MVFSEALKEQCGFDYEKIKFYYQISKEYDEEFYFMVLEFLKQKDDKENWKTSFNSLLNILGVDGQEFQVWAIIKTRSNVSLPEKILIIEDGDWVAVWEKFLENSWIEGVKVVSSQSWSNDSWEESIIKSKKLNWAYNPYIYRVIDSDGISDEHIQVIREKKEAKAIGLNYKLSVLDIHEIENLLLLDRAYQSTDFYKIYPDIIKFIKDKYADNLKNSFTSTVNGILFSTRINKSDTNFATEVNEIEKQMLLDPVRRINWKEVINLLRTECWVSQKAMGLLKNLAPENYPDDLLLLLESIKKYFES